MKEEVTIYQAWRTEAGSFISAKVGASYGVYHLELVDPSTPETCDHEQWRHAGMIRCTGPRVCFGCGTRLGQEGGAG